MPSIDIAMARSVATKRTLLDVLASAMGPVLYSRDESYVSDKITDVKTAFSSWGNCMQADFCKCVAIVNCPLFLGLTTHRPVANQFDIFPLF